VVRARDALFLLSLSLGSVACGEDAEVSTHPDPCARLNLTDHGDVRVFVIGHKQLLADAESYQTFERSYRRHVEAIESCLSDSRPNLVVFPENAALGALLIGARGEGARAAESSTAAFIDVLGTYGDAFDHYKNENPSLTLRRQLLLALTDVTWRAFQETFAGIAKDYGVWVLANADVAPAKSTSDAALAATLGDPEAADPSQAFVAEAPTPFNSAYLFDPSGSQAGRVDKVFLTDPEEMDLDLVNGSFEKLSVLDTPFARIGVATSRDAFYPPLMQRLEDLDVDLVVQPEAFSGWTVEELPGDWLPDVFLSSGWLHTQRYRTFQHSLNPVYTGNFFELVFDGQAHITKKAAATDVTNGYVGQDPVPGFTAVGGWVENDPGGGLAVDERRKLLRAVGKELLPGSGSKRENGYVDSVIAADLELPSTSSAATPSVERDTSLPDSRALSPTPAGAQRNPDLASDGTTAVAAWQDSRSGSWRIRVATSSDGATWSDSVEVDGAGSAPQKKPAVCSDGTRVAVTWQEGESPEQIRVAVAPNAGATFGAPISVAPGSAAQWDPDCGFLPGGDLAVVWTDFASGVAKIRVARLPQAGTSFDAPVAVDPSTDAAERLAGTQVSPAISESGGHLTWLDYRDRSWDVYVASFDGSAVTGVKRVDAQPAADDRERLHGEPRIEAAGDRVLVAWTDLRDRRGMSDIAFAWSEDAGQTFSERRLVPGGPASLDARSSGGSAMPRFRPAIALDATSAELVFQDLSPDKGAIFRSAIDSSGSAATSTRVDDTATSALSLTHPRAVRLGSSTLVVWEDDRESAYRVYASRL